MLEPKDEEFAQLVDWVEGRLSREEARTVEERIATDATARANVEWLQAFAAVSENTVIASPPPKVRKTLVERFEAYAERKRGPGILKRLVATLSFDSALQPAPGLRASYAPDQQREFVYCSEVADIAITVRLRPHDGLSEIEGQIFPINGADPEAFGVRLLDGASVVAAITANDLGEFSFGAVPPGTYEVLATSDRAEIWLTGIEVRRGR